MGRPPSSEKTTRFSEWFQNNSEITREAFAARLGIERQHVDRYARGERRPGLDIAFAIEDITKELSGGKDVLEARAWTIPVARHPESPKGASPKSHDGRHSTRRRKTRG